MCPTISDATVTQSTVSLSSQVMVMDVAAKTIGAMCMQPGDCILQINGTRQGSDAARVR